MSEKKTKEPGEDIQNRGVSTWRYKREPEELRFAKAWDHQCTVGRTLDHLLDQREVRTGHPPYANDRDVTVAATVIQWLGSNVGQSFLADLGYVRPGSCEWEEILLQRGYVKKDW
jgi:hypothetical protein